MDSWDEGWKGTFCMQRVSATEVVNCCLSSCITLHLPVLFPTMGGKKEYFKQNKTELSSGQYKHVLQLSCCFAMRLFTVYFTCHWRGAESSIGEPSSQFNLSHRHYCYSKLWASALLFPDIAVLWFVISSATLMGPYFCVLLSHNHKLTSVHIFVFCLCHQIIPYLQDKCH